jgi:Ras-related protein Rab-8A
MQIWDTAGQDRFQTITHTYYKGAMGIILAYDCTDEVSFGHIRNWIKQIEQHANPNVIKILIGNKCDKKEKLIDTNRGQALADEYQMPFFETSAKNNINIKETFEAIAREIIKKGDLMTPSQNLTITENNTKKSQSCCS